MPSYCQRIQQESRDEWGNGRKLILPKIIQLNAKIRLIGIELKMRFWWNEDRLKRHKNRVSSAWVIMKRQGQNLQFTVDLINCKILYQKSSKINIKFPNIGSSQFNETEKKTHSIRSYSRPNHAFFEIVFFFRVPVIREQCIRTTMKHDEIESCLRRAFLLASF